MKRVALLAAAVAATANFLPSTPCEAAAFTGNNLVVEQIGTGSAALSSAATAITLDEFSIAGTAVQQIALPTADSGITHAITDSGSAGSEGQLTLSADGQYLLAVGYDATPGTASVVNTASATTSRVVAVINSNGGIDTSTALNVYSANNIRSATSPDGTNLYLAGANTGIIYTTLGSSGTGTTISTTSANNRVINIFNGQLFTSSGSGSFKGISAVGTATSNATGQTAVLKAPDSTSGGAYAYFLTPDGTTLYVADASSGIIKYSGSVSGGFTADYTLNADGAVGGLTGIVAGGSVSLYATTYDGTKLVTVSDIEATTGTTVPASDVFSTLATAPTNTAYRSVEFAPVMMAANTPEPTSLAFLAIGGVLSLRRKRSAII